MIREFDVKECYTFDEIYGFLLELSNVLKFDFTISEANGKYVFEASFLDHYEIEQTESMINILVAEW